MKHEFEGTPQYEQIYGNQYGPPLGRPGNGLGDCPTPHTQTSPLMTLGATERRSDEELDAEAVWISNRLETLTERQRFVIELRYGFKTGTAFTQSEVADLMGVSRQAVSRLEIRAIKRLRLVGI